MLVLNPMGRITARDALCHPFIKKNSDILSKGSDILVEYLFN
jgi:hypothetical protein